MFGLTFEKLLLIGIIAVFLLGPERLPGYTAKLAQFVRSLRDMANGAKSRMRDEMGPEFDDVDWKKLDPRQYDPRRIIREALLDDGPADGGAATTSSVTPPNRPRPEPAYLQHKAKSAGGPVPVDLPGDAGAGGVGGAAAVGVVGAGAAAGGVGVGGASAGGAGESAGAGDSAVEAARPVATAYDSEAT